MPLEVNLMRHDRCKHLLVVLLVREDEGTKSDGQGENVEEDGLPISRLVSDGMGRVESSVVAACFVQRGRGVVREVHDSQGRGLEIG